MENTTLGALLDEIVSIREKMKGLDWFDGEDPFQIVLETIGTQQCRLVQAAIWSYDLKLLADEAMGGDMLSIVESELEDWIKSENTVGPKKETLPKEQEGIGTREKLAVSEIILRTAGHQLRQDHCGHGTGRGFQSAPSPAS